MGERRVHQIPFLKIPKRAEPDKLGPARSLLPYYHNCDKIVTVPIMIMKKQSLKE
jgi:hypothetical protein